VILVTKKQRTCGMTTTSSIPFRFVLTGFCAALCATLACGSPANFVPKDGGHGGSGGAQGSGGASNPQQDAAMDAQGDMPIASGGAVGTGGNLDGGGTGGDPGSGGVPAGSGGTAGAQNGTGGGAGGAQNSGSGGVPTGSGGTAGAPNGSGGRGGSPATGGKPGSGGAAGAPNGTGGAGATGGTTVSCQPKPRDCSSHLDNNCNGTPDDQETASCVCKQGTTQACGSHPQDGMGICKAGHQSCSISSDKTTSSWGGCTDSVGPGTEVCDAANLDENCNGQSNEGCECVNGTQVACECSGTAPCTNGKIGPCSKSKGTFYRDGDSDTYGDPKNSMSACSAPSGYVSNSGDCDDSNGSIKPGYTICDVNDRRYCATNGAMMTEVCTDGCLNGACRNDGTVGKAGWVSCYAFNGTTPTRCLTSVGCQIGICQTGGGNSYIACDGPNDCPSGQICCGYIDRGGTPVSQCQSQACSDSGTLLVCDPLQPNLCTKTCTLNAQARSIWFCI